MEVNAEILDDVVTQDWVRAALAEEAMDELRREQEGTEAWQEQT